MSRETISMAMAAALRADGVLRVMWGDGILVDVGQGRVKATHPLDVMDAVVRALERDTKRFKKFRVHGMDSAGRSRVVRAFELIEPAVSN